MIQGVNMFDAQARLVLFNRTLHADVTGCRPMS